MKLRAINFVMHEIYIFYDCYSEQGFFMQYLLLFYKPVTDIRHLTDIKNKKKLFCWRETKLNLIYKTSKPSMFFLGRL